jgi:UDP-N-acetylmuramyl pentapeptide phosphotransferase/UDP-N-acetylglucosamine-1-phosphate transferase
MNNIYFIIIPILLYFFNNILKTKKFFYNYSGESHQKFSGEKYVPLTGGLYLIIFLAFFLNQNFIELYIFLFLTFSIGLLSDLRLVSSPVKRFTMQTILILFFLYSFDLQISFTRINFLDHLLTNIYFSVFFTCFCLVILMNGSNFIDGLNGLVLIYYTIILIILFKLDSSSLLLFNKMQFHYLIYFLLILIVFNFCNKFYLGDSGTYLLSFFVGFLLIDTYNNNLHISPFFIVLLLWYPCFENLFSIIRKFKFNRSPMKPDNMHLHQLLFYFILKKIKVNKNYVNNFSSLVINFYNLVIFYLGSINLYNTEYLILLIILNILIYIISYLNLFKYKFRTKA